MMATSDQRQSLAEPLRAAVEEARSANALDGLARAMNVLLVQLVPDPDAEALAGTLMNAVLQMRMAIRLGSVRDERERLALVDAYAKLVTPWPPPSPMRLPRPTIGWPGRYTWVPWWSSGSPV
mgnify:CR=1 FL=1